MTKRERSLGISGYHAREVVVRARNQAQELPEDLMAFVCAALAGDHDQAVQLGREMSRKTRSISEYLDGALDGQFEGLLDKE